MLAWVNKLLGHLTREFVVNIVGCAEETALGEGSTHFASEETNQI